MRTGEPDLEYCVIGCLIEGGPSMLHQYAEQLRPALFCRPETNLGCGFTDKDFQGWPMRSEEDVFRFVGLPYAEPKDRK